MCVCLVVVCVYVYLYKWCGVCVACRVCLACGVCVFVEWRSVCVHVVCVYHAACVCVHVLVCTCGMYAVYGCVYVN